MADRPIIFSGPMVQALLAGRKTQTRRLIPARLQERYENYDEFCRNVSAGVPTSRQWEKEFFLEHLRYTPGDRLYVREAWSARMMHGWTIADARSGFYQTELLYRADGVESIDGWWPSIHMPREFSRLTLTVTDVRVQRLQDISEADAMAEGCDPYMPGHGCATEAEARDLRAEGFPYSRDYRAGFQVLWNSLHGPDAWDANPWVCAISFQCIQKNIDQITGDE